MIVCACGRCRHALQLTHEQVVSGWALDELCDHAEL